MDKGSSKSSKNPRFFETLKEDLRQKGHVSDRHREWKELQEFYLTDDQKDQLKTIKPVKGWFMKIIWILKSMFLKLSPFRRMLVLIAAILFFTTTDGNQANDPGEFSIKIPLAFCFLVAVIMLELKDKLLARDELEAGRKIQKALMPELSPSVEGWQIMLFTRSANEVGGDLVDFLRIDPRRISISLADISGKGLHAALLMSKLQATIRALTSNELTIEKLVSCVNTIFHRDTPSSIFASLLYLEIAPKSNTLRYINAGHLPPILLKRQGLYEMPKGGLGIGLRAGTQYKKQTQKLTSGNIFIGYSDGITEACNMEGDFYGVDRLKNLLPRLFELSAQQMGNAILQDVKSFVGDASMNDDMSLIVLKRE